MTKRQLAKIASVNHDFHHHLCSGFSGYLPALFLAVEERSLTIPAVLLLRPEAYEFTPVLQNECLAIAAEKLHVKFFEIWQKVMGRPNTELREVKVTVDFLLETSAVQKRVEEMKTHGWPYYRDADYRCEITMTLASGIQIVKTYRSSFYSD